MQSNHTEMKNQRDWRQIKSEGDILIFFGLFDECSLVEELGVLEGAW